MTNVEESRTRVSFRPQSGGVPEKTKQNHKKCLSLQAFMDKLQTEKIAVWSIG